MPIIHHIRLILGSIVQKQKCKKHNVGIAKSLYPRLILYFKYKFRHIIKKFVVIIKETVKIIIKCYIQDHKIIKVNIRGRYKAKMRLRNSILKRVMMIIILDSRPKRSHIIKVLKIKQRDHYQL